MTLDISSKNKNDGRPYSLKLQLQEDLIIPSYNKSLEAFLETTKDIPINTKDSVYLKNSGEDFVKEVLSGGVVKYKNQPIKTLKGLKNAAYHKFVHDLFSNVDRKKQFFDNLEKQGYNAIVDENDYLAPNESGKLHQFNSPLIIFKKSTVKQVGAIPITKEDKKYIDAVSTIYKPDDFDYELESKLNKYLNDPKLKKRWNDWLKDRPKKKR